MPVSVRTFADTFSSSRFGSCLIGVKLYVYIVERKVCSFTSEPDRRPFLLL